MLRKQERKCKRKLFDINGRFLVPQGILRQYSIIYNLSYKKQSHFQNPRQPTLPLGLPPLPKVERKSIKSCKTSGSQILGRAFQPNNRLVPIKGKEEDKVKALNAEKDEFVLKEDAAVQTDRLLGHTFTVQFGL